MKLFGTDGIRGRFGHEPITPQTILKLGWAIGSIVRIQNPNSPEVVIGKDTRISGYLLESALSSGLLSAGVNVALLGPAPTPAVSYFCRAVDAAAGIVVSASHNPVQDNGIKLLSKSGSKISTSIERKIEELMRESVPITTTEFPGRARRIDGAVEQYANHLCSIAKSRLDGVRIVVDCANGASYQLAPAVLTALGAEVISVGDQPNGYNINHGCGSTTSEFIQSCTIEHRADVGIALDGDGDRVVMVDEKGNLVDGDQILYIIAVARKRDGKLAGGVVGTHLSNNGLAHALSKSEIPFERVDVGDRFIAEKLKQLQWSLGGEQCGHILNGEVGVPGDGLVAASEVLSEMVNSKAPLSSLTKNVKLLPQKSRNVRLNNRNSPIRDFNLSEWPNTKKAVVEAESELNDSGRVFLRASGTEPAIRILVEGSDIEAIDRVTNQLSSVVEEEFSRFEFSS